jgi:hypothetical protein
VKGPEGQCFMWTNFGEARYERDTISEVLRKTRTVESITLTSRSEPVRAIRLYFLAGSVNREVIGSSSLHLPQGGSGSLDEAQVQWLSRTLGLNAAALRDVAVRMCATHRTPIGFNGCTCG